MNKKAYFGQLNVVYIEVTNKCNINCKYCYEVQKKQSKQVFTVEMFYRIIDNVAEFSCHDDISIIFHGGEPLLIPSDFYENCMAYATQTLSATGKTVSFGLQSNLMLLKDDLIPILIKYRVGISTSIDGPAEIHNQARAGFDKTIDNLHKLCNAGVKVNFITVCSHHNKDRISDLFQFAKTLNLKSLQLSIASCVKSINPESTYGPLSENEIFEIWTKALDCWKSTGVEERNIALMLKRYLNPDWDFNHTFHCESPFCYAGRHMFVFTPDGNMHLCSPAVPIGSKYPEFIAGNINNLSDKDRLNNALRTFHAKGDKYLVECQQCEASCICTFGCPAFDRIDPITAEVRCKATQRFYQYITLQDVQTLKQLISISL